MPEAAQADLVSTAESGLGVDLVLAAEDLEGGSVQGAAYSSWISQLAAKTQMVKAT